MPTDTSFKISTKATTKSMLSDYYKIDRVTLNKWIRFFCVDVFDSDVNNFKHRRKFTTLEVEAIKEKLGKEPRFFWKRDIIKATDSDYQTVVDNICTFPSIYPISEVKYSNLNKLPPKIARGIIKGLG